MTIKEQIKQDILQKGYFNNKLTDFGFNLWRHFIFGDFSEKDYLKSLEMQKETNKKKLIQFVIFNYVSIIAEQYNCSYGYAQKTLVSLFGIQSLNTINDELIDELMQLGK
tara:strand:+ start:262 stop:591 length:330 start_codon:yes stop_codon:yes gene_type:complete